MLHGLVIFGLFNVGYSTERFDATAAGDEARMKADPGGAFAGDPIGALRTYFRKGTDGTLYFAFTNLIYGEEPDWARLTETGNARRLPDRAEPRRPLMPYRDFGYEYPPLSLAPMLFPRLFTSTLDGYLVAFAIEMALLSAIALFFGIRLAMRVGRHDLRYAANTTGIATAAALTLGLLLVTRFDPLVALLMVLTLHFHLSGRPARGAVMLALAISTKLIPVVLAPLLYADALRDRRFRELARVAAALAGTLVAVNLPFLIVSGGQFLELFGTHAGRGLHIESIYAGVIVALRHAVGVDATMTHGFGSSNLIGVAADGAIVVAWVMLATGLAAVIAHYLKTQRRVAAAGADLARSHILNHSVALLAVFVSLGKVFSPQYLLWLYPIVLLVQGRRARLAAWLYIVACALTQLVYRFYEALEALALWPHIVLVARTLLLLATAAIAARAVVPRSCARLRPDSPVAQFRRAA